MFRQLMNWRTLLALIAIFIVSGTIWYSSYLANKIEKEERQKVEEWVEASNSLLNPANTDARLPFKIFQDNTDIPIIETNEQDSVTGWQNLDTMLVRDRNYLKHRLRDFKSENTPIVWVDPLDQKRINQYYYGHSRLLDEVRYYPLVQLFIVGLFILITLFSLRSSYRSTQNQVWAGMAKETAHQLGTPVSSLEGWVEILKESHGQESLCFGDGEGCDEVKAGIGPVWQDREHAAAGGAEYRGADRPYGGIYQEACGWQGELWDQQMAARPYR
jgi:hypothetical protein